MPNSMGSILPILIILAILMGLFASIILYYARNSDSYLRKILVYVSLAMMNGMLIGPAIYFLGFPPINEIDAVEISGGIMFLEVILPIFSFFNNVLESKNSGSNQICIPIIIFLTILNEFLMSMVFVGFSSGETLVSLFKFNYIRMVSHLLSSYWFIFPMSLEMGLTSVLTIRKEKGFFFVFIVLQSFIMLFTPDAVSNGKWETISIFVGASVMTVLLVYTFEKLYTQQYVYRGFSIYILMILAVYSVMMAGVMVYQYSSVEIVISSGIVAEMILYLHAILNTKYLSEGKKIYWLANQGWTTILMVLVFVTEIGMGATMDFQYYGTNPFINSMHLSSYYGNYLNVFSELLYNSIMFLGLLALSTWFYIMMGIEMGSLVVMKIFRTRELETRIRLVLMIIAYAVYSILIPSFILPATIQNYTFLGWSMGIGTGGGLAPILIFPLLLTYVISGTLSLLFGARQLCSVFCTAPMMYQGTFYGEMKNFNKTGRLAQKLSKAGEKSAIYKITSLTVYTSLGIASIISFLYNYKIIGRLTIYGTDPLYFIYIVLFGIVWYLIFITMPFFGNYGCINTGYCHWGNFNRFVGKYGLFKLKVKDPDQCVTCETKACTNVCPVGNSGQPGSFIEKGEYKESRCIGVGDCVQACPYENIFYYDVRNYLKEKLAPSTDDD